MFHKLEGSSILIVNTNLINGGVIQYNKSVYV